MHPFKSHAGRVLVLVSLLWPAAAAAVTVETRIADGLDDAEESSAGSMYLDSSDLELVRDGADQFVGMRFRAIDVPPRSLITAAWIQFTSDEATSDTTNLAIRAEAADNAAAYSSSSRNISARALTAASIPWSPSSWGSTGSAGSAQRTPSLVPLVQEVVNRPGWRAGQALAFMVMGTGRRVADSRDGSSSGAPLLHIEYAAAGPANQAPVVQAGSDQTADRIVGASLQASVSDDGLPNPPGAVTLQWSQVSGPGSVSFASPASASTTATFPAAGSYVLRITANDGQLSASDDLVVQAEESLTLTTESRVSSSSDDAEELLSSGAMFITSTDLEFVDDGGDQIIGMRFQGLDIRPGAIVTKAWLQLQVDETTSTTTRLVIQAEASDAAAAFITATGNISSRVRTAASVTWSPPSWPTEGEAGANQRTPDLSRVVQEVVSRPGWASGRPLALIVTGTGKRVAESYNGQSSAAPLLHVEYAQGPVAPPEAADEIHFTLLGQNAVTFDWRGPEAEDTLSYGTASGALNSTVAALPPVPFPDSSAGPFHEARVTGLREDTLYFYRIGSGPERTFRTPPPRGASGFWIAHEAEIGGPPTINPLAAVTQDRIAADLPALAGDDRPRFVLVGGGLSYADLAGKEAVDDHFNAVMPWSRQAAYMPAWGGREGDTTQDSRRNYEGRFEFPNSQDAPGAPASGGPGEEWMWFDYGNVRFISYPEPFQGGWLDWKTRASALMDQAQADPAIQFIVTWGNRPAWSSGSDRAGEVALASTLAALRTTHAKYVLNIGAGSRHYERTVPSLTGGLLHIVSGGGGAPAGGLQDIQPVWSAVRFDHLHHLRLQFLSDRIVGHAVCGPAGARATDACVQDDVIDQWSILPGGVSPPNQAPDGTISAPSGSVTIVAGQSVTFQGSGSDPDGNTPLRFAWSFGGGAAASSLEDPGAVTFASAGTYTVTFTVVDSLGLADPTPDRRTVTVVPVGAGRTFYASPQGSDGNAGTQAAPWKTLGFAGSRLAPGDTLYLRGGTYFESASVSVSGTSTAPITIASYPGESAVIDSGPREFRSAGNQDWELVDSSLGEYRSVRTLPSGNIYAYIAGIPGYRNERVALIPYVSSSAFHSASDVYVDSSTPFYVGPGTWRGSDGRVHVRLAKTAEMRAVEARYGIVLATENADPRNYAIVLSTAGATLTVRGSWLVFKDLTVNQARRAISLAAGAHDLTFEKVTGWWGDNVIAVDGTGVQNVRVLRSKLYGDVPLWVSWSDAKNAPAPADLMRGCSLELNDGAHDVRISYSHLRGGHDGIGVNNNEDRIVIDHNRIENFADDCLELEGTTSVGRIEVYENYIGNCLVAIAPGQDTPTFNGPLLVYRNVIALLANPFVNRKAGINSWNGGGRYGYEYMFKHGTGSSYSTRNSHYYHNTLVMLNSGGKGLNLTPKYPDNARIANNLAIMVNGVVNGSYTTGSGLVWNGDLYWKVNTVDSARLIAGYDTVSAFSSATGFERNGLGSVSRRGTDPLFATWRPPIVNRAATVWELLASGEVLKPSDFLLSASSPAIGTGISIPPHPVLGTLPDTRNSRDIGAIPLGTPASEYDVFPYVPGAP